MMRDRPPPRSIQPELTAAIEATIDLQLAALTVLSRETGGDAMTQAAAVDYIITRLRQHQRADLDAELLLRRLDNLLG